MKKLFIVGMITALSMGAFANLPSRGSVDGSMAPTLDVSEIRAKRQADLSFDSDLNRLSSVQGRYRENLPVANRKTTHRKKKISATRTRLRAKSSRN